MDVKLAGTLYTAYGCSLHKNSNNSCKCEVKVFATLLRKQNLSNARSRGSRESSTPPFGSAKIFLHQKLIRIYVGKGNPIGLSANNA